MSIHVEPYVPDEDYDNPAMVTDFYEFTMANCLYLHGFKDTVMVFDMFFRENPDNLGYSISCGQDKLVKFLLNYHFTEKDITWLRTKGMSEEFCEYLRTYRWKGSVYMLREGTVAYPQVPMVRIECDMAGAILIETYLLQTMNFHSLIATKATRITGLNLHRPRNVMEFGTRRAQGESAGNDGAYAAILGGCVGTANCLAEMKYGPDVKAVGTIAHSFIEFYPSEYEAFKAYAETYPENVSLLLDTYSIFESGLPNLIKIDDEMIRKYPNDPNKRVKSARIDSGDLARGYKKLRKALDKAGKPYIKLVASNALDEKKMSDMELYEDAHFDSYGVGENLITSSTDPVFGGVYKLVAVKNADGTYTPKMKCSDSASKAIIPGKLMAWRVFDEEGKGQCDIISMDDEVIEAGKPLEVINLDPDELDRHKIITPCHVERILVPHIINGELAIDLPTIAQKKNYIREQLENRVWESELRPEMPHKHYVDLTLKVAKVRSDMYEKLHGGEL
ncbi:MAG: nicotinate phosphoribosyltransferase [Lactimicrobium massiliense]|uniref:nicotinate phosphoribosyltransferase n=1 Tax=Lactimicrobium massiliense TaxID=2161814 RepID=UPI000D5557F3|nr:nicotinate phosphoribosyltransferase [Lactimicrobium massiliense]MDY3931031.1 nicotinate phosphoribosyltransferase [Erysipelotrichaceae bacterium]MDD6229349.1 nicotinate phosphoribosyltransferase [Lactimicrobium massiliense]MDD6458077.1 nicotinate phosphoribosyltransferase [Lactimicrobium massiliense]MDD6559970.1 nicotinate phosphoribosyltransferase [Lactimicrobium massiliense]MDD6674986.1 nicotinate phosphoribosyltransferase [Lactimicrobium massiliense]